MVELNKIHTNTRKKKIHELLKEKYLWGNNVRPCSKKGIGISLVEVKSKDNTDALRFTQNYMIQKKK